MESERDLGTWSVRTVRRSIMCPRGTPRDWAVEDGEWLEEELASRGAKVTLTNLRLIVVIDPTRANDQMCDRNPSYRRGEGGPVGLTMTERITVPIVVSLSRGEGKIGELLREGMGDFPPTACHVPLEVIRQIEATSDGRDGGISILLHVGGGPLESRRQLSLGLGGPTAVVEQLATALRDASVERWLEAGLSEALRDAVERARGEQASSALFHAPLSRPVAADVVEFGAAVQPDTEPASGTALRVSDLAMEARPLDPAAGEAGGWVCERCELTNPNDETRCLRCRQARADARAG
jgi:hypothetical protein